MYVINHSREGLEDDSTFRGSTIKVVLDGGNIAGVYTEQYELLTYHLIAFYF